MSSARRLPADPPLDVRPELGPEVACEPSGQRRPFAREDLLPAGRRRRQPRILCDVAGDRARIARPRWCETTVAARREHSEFGGMRGAARDAVAFATPVTGIFTPRRAQRRFD